jgi:dTDP-4-dehydrorhamnose 3,5-epimerase
MNVTELEIPGVLLIEPRVFPDERGFFVETFQTERYRQHGIAVNFVQDNLSRSSRGVLRGLHLQNPKAQGKLVSVPLGEVFDVAVDLRVGSKTFGKWVSALLSGENQHQLYIPEGCAHGFCVLSEVALFAYKCTAPYAPEAQMGVAHDDPDIGIAWPLAAPSLSPKDANLPRLAAISEAQLPRWPGADG